MLSHIQLLNNDKNYPGWLRDVHSRSSSLGKHLHILGLYTLTATDAEWASVATNIDDEGNIAARPTYPEPDALPLVATNSVIARFNIDMAKFISHNTLYSQLKEEIITSIGTVNLSFIQHPLTGTMNATPSSILHNMSQLYNVLSSTSIKDLQDKLNTPMSSSETFLEFNATFQTTILTLHHANQPVSSFNQIQALTFATSTNSHITAAIQSYIIEHPRVSDRHITTLISHIILHAPASLTSGSQGYANSAIPPLTRADVAAMIKAAHTKGVQEGKNMNNNNNNRNSNRNAHNTPTRPPNQPKYATKYCFVHGYNFSHIGTECKVMANDPTSTPQHKSAINSTTGGNANVQQA